MKKIYILFKFCVCMHDYCCIIIYVQFSYSIFIFYSILFTHSSSLLPNTSKGMLNSFSLRQFERLLPFIFIEF